MSSVGGQGILLSPLFGRPTKEYVWKSSLGAQGLLAKILSRRPKTTCQRPPWAPNQSSLLSAYFLNTKGWKSNATALFHALLFHSRALLKTDSNQTLKPSSVLWLFIVFKEHNNRNQTPQPHSPFFTVPLLFLKEWWESDSTVSLYLFLSFLYSFLNCLY